MGKPRNQSEILRGKSEEGNRSAVASGVLRTELTECVPGILASARPVDTLQRLAGSIDLFGLVFVSGLICAFEKPGRLCPDTNLAVIHQVEREDAVLFLPVLFT